MTDLQKLNNRILEITIKDINYKTTDQLLMSLFEEIGELATEIKIENKVFGNAHKITEEGTIGESIDVYICCMSLFYTGYILDGKIAKEHEEEVNERLALLKMKDTYNYVGVSNSYYLPQILRYINGPFRIYIEAAQCAINIFFKGENKEKDFYLIANKKLDKWEKSQNASIENMEIESKGDKTRKSRKNTPRKGK